MKPEAARGFGRHRGRDHMLAGLLKSSGSSDKRGGTSQKSSVILPCRYLQNKSPTLQKEPRSREVAEFVMRGTSTFRWLVPNPIWGNLTKTETPRHLNILSLEKSGAAGGAKTTRLSVFLCQQ